MGCKALKGIQEHCSDLALIISAFDYSDSFDWLMIAASIEDVEMRWNKFDRTSQRE